MTVDFLQDTLRKRANVFAKKQLALGAGDTPITIVQTKDSAEEPDRTDGTLWWVADEGELFYFDADEQTWFGMSPFTLPGMGISKALGKEEYAVRLFTVPEKYRLLRATFGLFAIPGCTGEVRLSEIGGGEIGSLPFSLGATGFIELAFALNTTFHYAAGLRAEIELTAGNMPGAVDVVLTARRVLK